MKHCSVVFRLRCVRRCEGGDVLFLPAGCHRSVDSLLSFHSRELQTPLFKVLRNIIHLVNIGGQ